MLTILWLSSPKATERSIGNNPTTMEDRIQLSYARRVSKENRHARYERYSGIESVSALLRFPVGSACMKITLNVLGAVLILMGCIWILQGVNILPGSFMTGQIQWAVYGAIAVAVGAALLLSANRRRKSV